MSESWLWKNQMICNYPCWYENISMAFCASMILNRCFWSPGVGHTILKKRHFLQFLSQHCYCCCCTRSTLTFQLITPHFFVRLLNYMESSRWLILVVLAYLWNQAGRTIFFLQKSLSKNQLSLFPKRVCIVCDIFYNNFLTKLGNRKQLARGTIYHQNAVGLYRHIEDSVDEKTK